MIKNNKLIKIRFRKVVHHNLLFKIEFKIKDKNNKKFKTTIIIFIILMIVLNNQKKILQKREKKIMQRNKTKKNKNKIFMNQMIKMKNIWSENFIYNLFLYYKLF